MRSRIYKSNMNMFTKNLLAMCKIMDTSFQNTSSTQNFTNQTCKIKCIVLYVKSVLKLTINNKKSYRTLLDVTFSIRRDHT